MSRWYRSLYWRIAAGFVLCLAAILVVQGVLLVWVASRGGPPMPGRPPERLARAVADDLAQALERDPQLDVSRYLGEQRAREGFPLFVLLADGRSFSSGTGALPESLLDMARARLRAAGQEGGDRPRRGDRRWPDADRQPGAHGGAGPSDRGPFGERGGRLGPRPGRAAPIVVGGRVVGVVVVPPRAPFGFLLRQYAPTLAVVAIGALLAGALLATVLVLGPARRRLRAVEDAARRLGSGDLTARAPSHGGDEVAAVARAFNAMADDLAARAEALAHSDRMRRQLLADVSHELTTPVTAMRGYLETLAIPELTLDPATRARYLQIVTDETGRLERIIRDLLDLARLEDGGGSLAVADVPVGALFTRVAARHERDAREAGVDLVTVVEPGAETIAGDSVRLEQALQNLTANALRYAPPGTSVELRARPAPGAVSITVTDHGAGIAPEHLPHVFERFYKAESSRAQQPRPGVHLPASGSGLGLSIVKAIVERHGGRAGVRSDQDGTTFELTVPRQAASPDARPA
jgi:signal transduction histidine kinase